MSAKTLDLCAISRLSSEPLSHVAGLNHYLGMNIDKNPTLRADLRRITDTLNREIARRNLVETFCDCRDCTAVILYALGESAYCPDCTDAGCDSIGDCRVSDPDTRSL